jgi:hypothetical protein
VLGEEPGELGLDPPAHRRLLDVELGEDVVGDPAGPEQPEQEVLGPDEAVTELGAHLGTAIQGPLRPRREGDARGRRGLLPGVQLRAGGRPDVGVGQLGEDLRPEALGLAQDAEQQVLGAHEEVAPLPRDLLGADDDAPGPLGVPREA